MYIINHKAILVILLTIGVILSLPAGTFAAQLPGADGEKTIVTQEFTYNEGEEPNIPETISQFGQILTLVSVSKPVENESLPTSRSYTYSVSRTYTPSELSQAPANVKLTPVYGEGTRQVDREEIIENLSNNDVDKLPQRKVYNDTNGKGPDTDADGDLALAEVKYEITGRDGDGLPNRYTAYVVYRGEETYTQLLYYTAVTTYTDTVTENGSKTYTVVATYEGYAPADDPDIDTAGTAGDGFTDGDGSSYDGDAGVTVSNVQNKPISGSGFQLPFSIDTLSPVGAAALATVAAAALTLLILSVYNRRKIRESDYRSAD